MAKKCPIKWFAPSGKDSFDVYRKSNMSSSKLDHQQDFTTAQYAQLLRLARSNYKFIGYRKLALGEKFVLWRHDCDYSLNRSLRLAQIEHQESVKATYFLNPHCEFYNLLEKEQAQIVKEILTLGHDIGLHFDAAYYDVQSEGQLDALVEREASWLADWFGVKPVAFSFHNPTEFLLSCDQDNYGGLPNCYSKTFKTKIPYCSDSNGYWRFRRLWDVLESAQDPCLQVLTHPGWWQEAAATPRERIFRSVDGRAVAVMRAYDKGLEAYGRTNYGCLDHEFEFLKKKLGGKAGLIDHRWMRGEAASVYVDLWRLFESQLVKFCRIWFRKTLGASPVEVNSVIESSILRLPMHRMFAAIYQKSWVQISEVSETEYLKWQQVRNHLVHGLRTYPKEELQAGVVFLVRVMEQLSKFGETHLIAHDGLRHAGEAGLPSRRTKKGACLAWISESHQLIGVSQKTLQKFVQDQGSLVEIKI